MKKVAIFIFTVAFMLSCGSRGVVNEARRTMAGDWRLSSITYPGNQQALKVTLLNNIPSNCLEGSNWNFVSNNNTGSYEPSGAMCQNEPNFFIWTISETDASTGRYDLLFKPTDADYNSTTGNQGYRLNLTNLSQTSMVWEQTIRFEGEPFTIRMNFTKI